MKIVRRHDANPATRCPARGRTHGDGGGQHRPASTAGGGDKQRYQGSMVGTHSLKRTADGRWRMSVCTDLKATAGGGKPLLTCICELPSFTTAVGTSERSTVLRPPPSEISFTIT